MLEQVKELNGSPNRDLFKNRHKKLNRTLYACDADLFLLVKPHGPIALLDYKTDSDRASAPLFSEVLLYSTITIPVYIVSGNAETGAFVIERFVSGEWKPNPPTWNLEVVATTTSWEEYEAWEIQLRKACKK